MPMNGNICECFGVSKTVCCGIEMIITDGARFPDCPNHIKLSTNWKSVTEGGIRHVNDLPEVSNGGVKNVGPKPLSK